MTTNNISKQCPRCRKSTKHNQDREGVNLYCGECGLKSSNLCGVSSMTRDTDDNELFGSAGNEDDNDFFSGSGSGNCGSLRIVATRRTNRKDAKFFQRMIIQIENDLKMLKEKESEKEKDKEHNPKKTSSTNKTLTPACISSNQAPNTSTVVQKNH